MLGTDVARRIRAMILDTEAAHQRLGHELSQVEAAMQKLAAERGDSFAKLAELYLPELGEDADRLRELVPQMSAKIDAILWEKHQDIRRVEEDLAANRQARTELEAALAEATTKVEAKAQEREELEGKVATELKALPEHAELVLQTQQAKERLLQSKRRLDAAVQDRDDKIPTYAANPLFSYLMKRGYATAAYRGNFLASRLDAWVARCVNFREQQQNYQLLQEVPEVMQKEIGKSEQALESMGQQLLALERRVEDRLGLTRVMEEGDALYQARLGHIAKIEELDGAFGALVSRQKELDNSRGQYYAKALREYRAFLESQSIERLKALARSTDTRSDDGLTLRIEALDQELGKRNGTVEQLTQERDKQGEQLRTLLQFEGRFRQEDFDASNSFFGEGFDLTKLLAALMAGAYGLEKAMGLIRQFQRFRRVDYERGAATVAEILITVARASQAAGGFRGGRGSRSRGGFPGFGGGRPTGGFGGGRSRTTGGFG